MEKKLIKAVLPEILELEEVDFGQFSPPYPKLLRAFWESGGRGLREFQKFSEESVGKKAVGQLLISLLQYLLILHRRFNEYSVVKPAVKVFITLKGWLNENGFERDWERLLSSFIGYLVTMVPAIAEKEDCESANAYLTVIRDLTEEASKRFDSDYYDELLQGVEESLKELREKCGISAPERKRC
ncbi:hypothetical protein [Thermococcus sp.]|uniref:hypothetical protein n=1 Tax=Thermococcus sp. TaxID=35749 RepID=UPI00261848A5|nr:hypothetical protein [Thermococcus sp.]